MRDPDELRIGSLRLTPGWILLSLMLLAVVLRVVIILVARPMIQFDETSYVRMAQNLAEGNAPFGISGRSTTHYTLLLPVLITAVGTLVRDHVAAGYAVVTAFGALMLIPVYLIGKFFHSRRVGLMAAALLAVMPIFISTPEYIYPETIYIFFLLSAAFFGWQMLNRMRVQCSVFTGLSLGFAYLASPLAVVYLPLMVLLALAVAVTRRHWKLALRSLGLMLTMFALVAAPYVVYLHHELGQWTLTGKKSFGHDYYASSHGLVRGTVEWDHEIMRLNDEGTEVLTLSPEFEISPVDELLHRPAQVLKVFLKQSLYFYNEILFKLFPLWLLPLLGLGLFAAAWDRTRLRQNAYLFLWILPAVPVTAMLAFTRFYMPYLPFVLVWTAVGWKRLEGWGRETVQLTLSERRQALPLRLEPWVIAALVILPLAAFGLGQALRADHHLSYREAGLWLKQEAGEGRRVMYREEAAFYAGGTLVPLPYADYESTTRYARQQGVDFLIISQADIGKWRPDLAPLLEDDTRPADWELVHTIAGENGDETFIFKLEPEFGAGGGRRSAAAAG